jgi:hypothetical protein
MLIFWCLALLCCLALGQCPDESSSLCGLFSLGPLAGAPNVASGSCCNTSPQDRSLSFTAPVAGLYTFDTCQGTVDTCLYVLGASCAGSQRPGACNEDFGATCGPSGWGSRVVYNASALETVVVVVQGFNGFTSGQILLSVTGPAGCPLRTTVAPTTLAPTTPPPLPIYIWAGLNDNWRNGSNWRPPADGTFPNRFTGFFDTYINYTLSNVSVPLLSFDEGVSLLRISGPVAKLRALHTTSLRATSGTIYFERSEVFEWNSTIGVRPVLIGCLEFGGGGTVLNVSFSWDWGSGLTTPFDCVNDVAANWNEIRFLGDVSWTRPQTLSISSNSSIVFEKGINRRGGRGFVRRLTAPVINLGQNQFETPSNYLNITASTVLGGSDEFRLLSLVPFGSNQNLSLVGLASGFFFDRSVSLIARLTVFECSAPPCVFTVSPIGSCFAQDILVPGERSRFIVTMTGPLISCPQSLTFQRSGFVDGRFSGVMNVSSKVEAAAEIMGSVYVNAGGNLTGSMVFNPSSMLVVESGGSVVLSASTLQQLVLASNSSIATLGSTFNRSVHISIGVVASLDGGFVQNLTCFQCQAGISGSIAGADGIFVVSGSIIIPKSLSATQIQLTGASSMVMLTEASLVLMQGLQLRNSSNATVNNMSLLARASVVIDTDGALRLEGRTSLGIGDVLVSGSLNFDSGVFSSSGSNITCLGPAARVSGRDLKMSISPSLTWSFINCSDLRLGAGSELNVTSGSVTSPFDSSNSNQPNVTVFLNLNAGMSFGRRHVLGGVTAPRLPVFSVRSIEVFDSVEAETVSLSEDLTIIFHISSGRAGKLSGNSLLQLSGARVKFVYDTHFIGSGSPITLFQSRSGAITGTVTVSDFGGIPAILSTTPFEIKVAVA